MDDSYHKQVFIVHGRDHRTRDELTKFVQALGLQVLTWEDARTQATRKVRAGAPTTLEIIETGMHQCKVILVLMTPDETVELKNEFAESEGERLPAEQPRPNVIFEAGLALGLYKDRTVIVETRSGRVFTDLEGINRISLASVSGKMGLKTQLSELCRVDPQHGWESVGEFSERFDVSYRAWREEERRDEHLLRPEQLSQFRKAAILPDSEENRKMHGYALVSAVHHGRKDLSYWIRTNENNEYAIRALIHHIAHSSNLVARLRAAKALEGMSPGILSTEIGPIKAALPAGKKRDLSLAYAARQRKTMSRVKNTPLTTEGLTAAQKENLLQELKGYPFLPAK
ncbi:nucleotide-binding protein [Streptomyces sp. NPDC058279]|uniref:nucleotide-binding protein n=1 Tax=Streptomyces sp. NPDC058279 TaxID=3346418 RepID=UPI0036E245BD